MYIRAAVVQNNISIISRLKFNQLSTGTVVSKLFKIKLLLTQTTPLKNHKVCKQPIGDWLHFGFQQRIKLTALFKQMGPVVQIPIDLTLGKPKIQRKLPNSQFMNSEIFLQKSCSD